MQPEGRKGIRPATAGPGEARGRWDLNHSPPFPDSRQTAARTARVKATNTIATATQHRLEACGAGGNNHAAGKEGEPTPTPPNNPQSQRLQAPHPHTRATPDNPKTPDPRRPTGHTHTRHPPLGITHLER